jgi:phosphopantetheinyl transferase (holo-ACP synthase)
MASEYYLREACSKAIATRLAKRATEYVTEDMVKCREKLMEVQADFNQMVEQAAHQMLKK